MSSVFRTYQTNLASQMEGNKYKLLMRISLADLEIVKGKFYNKSTSSLDKFL